MARRVPNGPVNFLNAVFFIGIPPKIINSIV
jgi:hypothetical protein